MLTVGTGNRQGAVLAMLQELSSTLSPATAESETRKRMPHTPKFLLAGVMGYPVMHSRSPKLHNFWLQQYGLAGSYVPLEIRQDTLERSEEHTSELQSRQ